MNLDFIMNASSATLTPGGAFVDTLTNVNLWAAILSTIGIISLGYILVKVKVFKADFSKILNSIVLKVALPALALTGFMTNASIAQLKEQGIILGVSFAFYIILSIIAMLWVNYFPKLLPNKLKVNANSFEGAINQVTTTDTHVEVNNEQVASNQKRALVMWMMLIFGSTTFFGMPIIKILYPSDGVIAANMWNIAYRIFLYSFCFMVMSGLKFDKANIAKSAKTALLNPIVICTFIGLVCWLTQLIPGASNFYTNFQTNATQTVYSKGPNGELVETVKNLSTNGWFNWSVTMPYFHKPIDTVGQLSSPLVWLSIGITLAGASLLSAVKNMWVWVFSAQKLILIPLLIFGIMVALKAGGLVTVNTAVPMVIFAATPPATVVIAYAMQYKTSELFATQCSALSTLLAIIAIPLWIVITVATFQII